MAQSSQDQDPRERKRELALSLDSSRACLLTRGRALRRRLNPVRAAGSFLRRHPLRIFGATTVGVAVLTYLLRPRDRHGKPPKSVRRRLLGWVISILKPAIRIWIVKQAKDIIQPKHVGAETDSLLGP